ncbi:uncharacterized protein [Epargyreus clarus]|uniref:uncharacterized protein isoform X1 n=1 Tax=Epargyreus clarus TaxID=520877 RepID=UPI003C2B0151
MGRRTNYLILHIEEWKRLKSQGSPTDINKSPPENEYIKSLIEKSQKWIETWPDTVQGHVCLVEKQKKKQHAKDVAMIRQFKMKHKTDTTAEAIEKAKKMIFDESCYGRRLLSALIESKTLEERDVQIEFEKELANKAKAREQQDNKNIISCSLQNATNMEKHEKELAKLKRDKNKEVAQVNKYMYVAQNEIKAQNEKKRRHKELEDLHLIRELIEKETLKEPEKKILFRKDLEQIIADRKEVEQRKMVREYEDERKAKIWRNYEDRKNYKIEMIHKKRFDTPQCMKHFDLINKLEEEKKSRYEEFVNSGVTTLSRQLQEDDKKKENERKVNYLLMQSNKKLAESKRITEYKEKKCTCDRQSIITKSKRSSKIKSPLETDIPTVPPSNRPLRAVKNIKMKERESTPWTGTSAAHAQFAQQANETLRQCQYKNMARKVVDDYRRLNCLNPEKLPIPDYF